MEKRQAKRIELNAPINLSIEDQKVRGKLMNLSNDGALFRVEKVDADSVTEMHLGLDARFELKPRSSPRREYTGELIRLYYQSDEKYLALRFWKKYRELKE